MWRCVRLSKADLALGPDVPEYLYIGEAPKGHDKTGGLIRSTHGSLKFSLSLSLSTRPWSMIGGNLTNSDSYCSRSNHSSSSKWSNRGTFRLSMVNSCAARRGLVGQHKVHELYLPVKQQQTIHLLRYKCCLSSCRSGHNSFILYMRRSTLVNTVLLGYATKTSL